MAPLMSPRDPVWEAGAEAERVFDSLVHDHTREPIDMTRNS